MTHSSSHAPPRALALAWRAIALLVVANALYAAFVVAIFVALLALPDPTMSALGVRADVDRTRILLGMRVVAVLGLGAALAMHRLLTTLRAIVGTVRDGDPFVPDNATRLDALAWMLLVLQVLHLAVGAVARAASSPDQPFDIDWSFSPIPWLTVLLLFVLARVFREGTRLRADLAGLV